MEENFSNMVRKSGFKSARRLRRYPEYNNIRKIFAPLYKDYEKKLSKVLYGDGILMIRAKK